MAEHERRDVHALVEAEGDELADLVQRCGVHPTSLQARFLEGTVRTADSHAVAPRRRGSANGALRKTAGERLIGTDGGQPDRRCTLRRVHGWGMWPGRAAAQRANAVLSHGDTPDASSHLTPIGTSLQP